MKKLLRPKDILMLGLAGIGDLFEEVKDPLSLASYAYENMYGFIPKRYKRHNFVQVVQRSLKTKDIEIVIKDGKKYLTLTSAGKKQVKRDFPIINLTKNWNKKWVLIIFDINEKDKKIRERLRLKLKNLGFGMLQKSVWLTPLPIEKELLEYMKENDLSENVFVLEISSLLLGDPKTLAEKIWNLKEQEKGALKIKEEISNASRLIEFISDRIKIREAKGKKGNSNFSIAGSNFSEDFLINNGLEKLNKVGLRKKLERTKRLQRELNRGRLDLLVSLPPLPIELFPKGIKGLF